MTIGIRRRRTWSAISRSATATPFQLDALTQMVVASLVLRCVDGGWLSLDDRVGKNSFQRESRCSCDVASALSHTTDGSQRLTFSYRPDRLAPLAAAVSVHRLLVSKRHRRPARSDGDGRLHAVLPTSPGSRQAREFSASAIDQYRGVLDVAVPYAVDSAGRPSASPRRRRH
jgi:hypothetical protein